LYKFDRLSLDIFTKLFDSQVQPIVQYGAEVWGLMQGTTIEKVHLFALKRFLGVDRRTPNDLVYGEFGRFPIYLNSYVRCIRYWLKLTRMDDSRLPRKAYKMLFNLDSRGKSTWATNIRVCLCKYGFQYVWINQGVACVNTFLACFKQRIIDCRWQEWDNHIQTSDRFALYRTFKTTNLVETYLSIPVNRHILNIFVKFRLGISSLASHSQRYKNINENNLVCRLCKSTPEDELHVVFCCPELESLRRQYIPAKFCKNPSKFKLALLLSVKNETILCSVAKFLYCSFRCFENAA
jgi:hypothetical protein